ncbi:shikimate dehydrogenase family protein [Pedobacter sp. PWIIR3]
MRKFGLIGFPLSHSFSKKFFAAKFDNESITGCDYELYPLENFQMFESLINGDKQLEGLNVTIPYKLEVLTVLNEVDDAAKAIGAVNCIKIERIAGVASLKGYNTDAYGFEESLRPLLESDHKKALVLGDGGAAKAVKYVLNKLGIPFIIVARRPSEASILYSDITSEMMKEYTIIINTTPLGMSPDVVSCPEIPYDKLSPAHLVYDLVYNPEETTFLNKARINGSKVKNGLEMLYLQAERSWYLWNQ